MELSANRILVVGCVHANTGWLIQKVLPTARELGCEAVLVAGDFGYWASERKFLDKAKNSLVRFGVSTWFIDGNHEEHPRLSRESGDEPNAVNLGGSLFYIRRGGKVKVGGVEVVGLGGAASIDRLYRTPGRDWFSEEFLTEEDIEKVSETGRAPVLITHDAPSGWAIPGLIARESIDPLWVPLLDECTKHRIEMRRALEIVRPKLLIHSHYHSGYELISQENWGQMRVVGLDRDNSTRWGRVLSEVNGEPVLSDWV